MDMLGILIMMMVSRLYTYVKTYQSAHFMCSLLYINHTSINLFWKERNKMWWMKELGLHSLKQSRGLPSPLLRKSSLKTVTTPRVDKATGPRGKVTHKRLCSWSCLPYCVTHSAAVLEVLRCEASQRSKAYRVVLPSHIEVLPSISYAANICLWLNVSWEDIHYLN